jgi:hypothetical protein
LFKIQSTWIPTAYVSYASFNGTNNGVHSQLVVHQNASAAIFSQKIVSAGPAVK